jgi:hypothetical protein
MAATSGWVTSAVSILPQSCSPNERARNNALWRGGREVMEYCACRSVCVWDACTIGYMSDIASHRAPLTVTDIPYRANGFTQLDARLVSGIRVSQEYPASLRTPPRKFLNLHRSNDAIEHPRVALILDIVAVPLAAPDNPHTRGGRVGFA